MDNKKIRIIQIGIVVLSVAFIAVGAWRGEGGVVLKKAIQICLSCIGIG